MAELFHATSRKNLKSIAENGLNKNSYWADDPDVVDYYKETITDEREVPVVLFIDSHVLESDQLEPDYPGIEEPLTYTLGMSEDEVSAKWENTDQTWEDCLDLIGSCRYKEAIPAEKIMVLDGEDLIPIQEYAASIKSPRP